ncbi:hypothetical protein [Streptomyces alboflavus]|nr:hypothetical protein [Streptomyces alboflavus]
MPGSDHGDHDRQAHRKPRRVLGPVGQFLALVTALMIDLTIRRLFGA